MPEYLTPGVYIEEVATGPVPIQGVSTSTIGFVGMAERGPTQPKLLTSWLDYQRWYGGYTDPDTMEGYLPWSVQGFFDNGGQRAFVTRIVKAGATSAKITLPADPVFAAAAVSDQLAQAVDAAKQALAQAEADKKNADDAVAEVTAKLKEPGISDDEKKRLQAEQQVATANQTDLDSKIDLLTKLSQGLEAAEGAAAAGAKACVTAMTMNVIQAVDASARAVAATDAVARIAVRGEALVSQSYDTTAEFRSAALRAQENLAAAETAQQAADAKAKAAQDDLKNRTKAQQDAQKAYDSATGAAKQRAKAVLAAATKAAEDADKANTEAQTALQTANQTVQDIAQLATDYQNDVKNFADQSKEVAGIVPEILGFLSAATTGANDAATAAGSGAADKAKEGARTAQGQISAAFDKLTQIANTIQSAPPKREEYDGEPSGLVISASGPGLWGNKLLVKVGEAAQRDESATPPRPWFSLTVMYYAGGVPSPFWDPDDPDNVVKPGFQDPDAREFYDNLSMDPNSPHYVMTVVNSASKLIAVSPGALPVPPKLGAPVVDNANSSHLFTDKLGEDLSSLYVWAKPLGNAGNDIGVQFTPNVPADGGEMTVAVGITPPPDGGIKEEHQPVLISKLAGYINRVSKLITLQWDPLLPAEMLKQAQIKTPPKQTSVTLPPTSGGVGDNPQLNGGGDGKPGYPTLQQYQGTDPENRDKPPELKSGLEGLKTIRDISLLCVPDEGVVNGLTSSIVQQCEALKNRFAVLQFKKAPGDPQNIVPLIDTSYAAVYYPWINVLHPQKNRPICVPPGGHIAGVFARTDNARGVFKAPANEPLLGPILQDVGDTGPLQTKVNDGQQAILNPKGVNCIRDFRSDGHGVVVWGARTQSTNGQWRYVPVRRLFIFVEESIKRGTQWVVFEPNDPFTWTRVVSSVSGFLNTVWKSGALFGTTPQEAFFVNCDQTTMTQDDIDNGRLVCFVGIAPVKPAEFVIFRFTQKTASAPA